MQAAQFYPNSLRDRREGLVDWAMDRSTHAIDLAPNRHDDIGAEQLRGMFRRFCLNVDRYMLRTKHVYLRNSHDRLFMIAMPEKLAVNPHLHGFADLSEDHWGSGVSQVPWEWAMEQIWREVTDGSGTVSIRADFDRGAAVYATKEAMRRDHDYLLSWDFHRSDKLVKHPPVVRGQRTAANRKARTH